MGLSTDVIYISSDNLIKIEGLRDLSVDPVVYVNDATVKCDIMRSVFATLDAAATTSETGGADTGLVITAHGITYDVGQYVRLCGSGKGSGVGHDGLWTLITGGDANKIIISDTYSSVIMRGVEQLFFETKLGSGGVDISMAYESASDGIYSGTIPDTVGIAFDESYWLFITITTPGSLDKVLRYAMKGAYAN
ncbi:MAG: hypothetical protein FVQ80_11455 [Planctomycetes bacterium]|nr:hypothetical protein [Planctomycetota bacterium]